MSDFFRNKKVLVTGGTGLIGIPLVQKLVKGGAEVRVVSKDPFERIDLIRKNVKEFRDVMISVIDLMDYEVCLRATKNVEYVFQLAGSKGSTFIGTSKAATFFDSHMYINLNMLRASRSQGVKKYLLTSTVGVYPPDVKCIEENVWKGYPHPGDKYSAWAKRMAELQAEAYGEEYEWDGIVIVRPTSTYGPWDDFNSKTAMVVPSLIARFFTEEDPICIVGDGTEVRDFTYCEDIADGMLLALEKSGNGEAFNLGCGREYTIKDVVEYVHLFTKSKKRVNWGYSTFLGNRRVVDITKAKNQLGFNPSVVLAEGLHQTLKWYEKVEGNKVPRYNAFL